MQYRLTSVQRRLLSRTFLIGALLTLAVVAVDQFGVLQPLERYFYDRRARWCQAFMPPPSTQIVHVNLDDQALTEIGRWPWPRADIARLVDELHAAGATVIALDMILAEPQAPRRAADSDEVINDDDVLARSITAAGNVLLPTTSRLKKVEPNRPIAQAMLEAFSKDLEIEVDELKAQLSLRFDPKLVETAVRDEFLSLHSQAMYERMVAECRGVDVPLRELLPKITPKAAAKDFRSDAVLTAETVYQKVLSVNRLSRFFATKPIADLPLLVAVMNEASPPIPKLSAAAAFSGTVDFVPDDDAIVRSVPLVMEYDGKLYPHMAFATALAALDVRFSDLRVERDRIIVPLKDGDAMEIPIEEYPSKTYGRVGGLLSLSWFGRPQDWWAMYDYPVYARHRQQMSASKVWKVPSLAQSIAINEKTALETMLYFIVELSLLNTNEAQFRARWAEMGSAERVAELRRALDDAEVKEYFAQYADTKPEELDESGKVFLATHAAAARIAENNAFLLERMRQERAQLQQELSGKVVVVGWTAAGRMDFYPTSLHAQCPGAVIQGVAINTILTRHFWHSVPRWVSPLSILAMGAMVTLVVAYFSSYRALLATLFLAGSYAVLNFVVLFDWGNLIAPMAGAMTAAGLVWGILTLYRYIFESAERTRITKRFSSYVDPAIVNYYIEDPDRVRLDGEVRDMTVVFTDLAGFTTISEKLQERTVPLLNDYMSRMMPLIRRHNGRWNKFLGDGIMFFYNAPQDDPQHARAAVLTVIEMQQAVEEFNKDLLKQGLPKVAMRAGIVTGSMVVGDSGSMDPEYYASDYTVLGDNVNLSARLESANKALGTRVLCVERTIEQMGNGILYRPVARLQVVGKTQGVMTYEPLCLEADATPELRRLVELTRAVVDAYVHARFDQCVAAAEAMQNEVGSSKFTTLYLDHARALAAAPPEEAFDGTIVLEAK